MQPLLALTLWGWAARLCTLLAALVIGATLARLLSPTRLGEYFIILSIASFLSLVGQAGLNHAIVRLVSEFTATGRSDQAIPLANKLFAFGCLCGVVCAATYLVVGPYLARIVFHSSEIEALALLTSVWGLLLVCQTLLSEVFRGFGRIHASLLFGGVLSGVATASGLVSLYLLDVAVSLRDALILSVATVFGSAFIGWTYFRIRLRKPRGARNTTVPSIKFATTVFGIAGPSFLINVIGFLATQGDLWIVGAFFPLADAASYGAAARLALLVSVPIVILNVVLAPTISSKYWAGDARSLEKVLRVSALLCSVPSLGLYLCYVILGPQILSALFGVYYQDAWPLLLVLGIGHVSIALTGSCGLLLLMTGHQRHMLRLMFVVTAIGGALALIAAPRYGLLALAGIVSTGMVAQNVGLLLLARARCGVWTHVAWPKDTVELSHLLAVSKGDDRATLPERRV